MEFVMFLVLCAMLAYAFALLHVILGRLDSLLFMVASLVDDESEKGGGNGDTGAARADRSEVE